MNEELDRFLTTKQVEDILQVSRSTVDVLRFNGSLKYIRIGSCVRISENSLRDYITGKLNEERY